MGSVFTNLHPTVVKLVTTTTILLVGGRGFKSPARSPFTFNTDMTLFLNTFCFAGTGGTGPVLLLFVYKVVKLFVFWAARAPSGERGGG